MDFVSFRSEILTLDGAGIIEYINTNRQAVKLVFIKAIDDPTIDNGIVEILTYLTQLNLSREIRDSDEIQFLYFELGLFFKARNNTGFVSTCFNKISSDVLKYRLKAWLSYKQYTNIQSHIIRLSNYLTTLSLALSNDEASYENEVLRDLHDYITETEALFLELGEAELAEEFLDSINSAQMGESFPILEYYLANKQQFYLRNEINPYLEKIFEPSIFSQQLFEDKFILYIKRHPRTIWNNILIGKPYNEIRNKIIGRGQTDYDKKVDGLESMDIVKLYAYCNMRMHFFSSLYLFERLDAFLTLYNSPGRVKFIDIGCGPATAGLSFIDYLYNIIDREISFDYIGVDYHRTMLNGAAYFLDNPIFRPVQAPVLIEDPADLDYRYLNDANSILINTSYLFASDNLDPNNLAEAVMNIRKSQPTVPCYLLFQNSVLDSNNIKYLAFKEKIGNFEIIHTSKKEIHYSNQRFSLYSSSTVVYHEILKIA